MPGKNRSNGLYAVHISVHGLVRGRDLELGRDADTGGQILYVINLLQSLAAQPQIDRVELLTRQIVDPAVGPSYAQEEEGICPGATIRRLPCGPRAYVAKEQLWPHLDTFVENALGHFRRTGRKPDLIHSHYADAGYVGVRLARALEVPLFHTAHSLGAVKRQRLLNAGSSLEELERKYHMSTRLRAEEEVIGSATRLIALSRQELEAQYSLYSRHDPSKVRVIPPGLDLGRFHPPVDGETPAEACQKITRFLRSPGKPAVLAIARADARKNLCGLVRAFGENAMLRQKANLVIVAGRRDSIRSMVREQQDILTELLMLIDDYDLYGQVAYPKDHALEDIPEFYRYAVRTRGVFVNPAFTEPFGLTLIEAAASGLPVLACDDGGPREIISQCQNGRLINPLETRPLGDAILRALTCPRQWKAWSERGVQESNRRYRWQRCAESYLCLAEELVGGTRRRDLSGRAGLQDVPRLAGAAPLRRASPIPVSALSRGMGSGLVSGDGSGLWTGVPGPTGVAGGLEVERV